MPKFKNKIVLASIIVLQKMGKKKNRKKKINIPKELLKLWSGHFNA
jgi:hypothetical protein